MQWWRIPRRGWIIILAELAVIVSLAGGFYSEYVNNAYFQLYVNGLSPILLPILSVGLGIASATIATLLYFTTLNIRQKGRVEEKDSTRRHVPARKTMKKTVSATSRTEKPTIVGPAMGPKAKPPVAGLFSSKRQTAQESEMPEDEKV